MSEEFWFKHRQRKAWFESRTPKEIEEIEQWMIERHKLKLQLAEARELLNRIHKHHQLPVWMIREIRELVEKGE